MKRLILLLMVLCVSVSLFAFDWGGYLDNVTGIAKSPAGVPTPVSLIQIDTLALWGKLGLGAWELDGQASYTFTPAIPLLVDLDRLSISGEFAAAEAGPTTFAVKVGRFDMEDASGYILNHTLDGIQIDAAWPRSALSIAIGTTALVMWPSNGMLLSDLDVDEQVVFGSFDPFDEEDPGYPYPLSTIFDWYFAPPRIIATGTYQLFDLFAGQNLTIGAVLQNDLRGSSTLVPMTPVGFPDESVEAGGQVDTQYVSLAVSGSLAPGLFHRTVYAINTGRTLTYLPDPESGTGYSYQYALILGHLAGLEVNYFLPAALNSRIRLSGIFSTGDADADSYVDGNTAGIASAFVPITPSAFSDTFSLQPGNSTHVALSYSLRPLSATGTDILQTEVKAAAYFRTAGSGPVSEPSVDPATSEAYIGTDVGLVVTAQPFSDLRLVLAGGAFVPNPAAMSADNKNVDYQITLQGVLRF